VFALTFLGTSASVSYPGLLVQAGAHRILADCGEGTQRQLLRRGSGFRWLDRILLTHGHLDRVLGRVLTHPQRGSDCVAPKNRIASLKREVAK
jgi:ribonuclease BN (tRNA processing enzyme)